MNYLNEPVFIQIMADWMAQEFPHVQYESESAWWVVNLNRGRRDLVAWIGGDKAFNVGPGSSTSKSLDPHSPTFFEECKAAIMRRLQETTSLREPTLRDVL